MQKYCLEFILHVHGYSAVALKNALSEFGEGLQITDSGEYESETKDLKININSEEPTVIFDICGQFGRIKSVRIHEEGRR